MAQWNPRANELFVEALALPDPATRQAWLEREAADPELHRQVQAMLAAHDQAGDFLDRPHLAAAADLLRTAAYVPPAESPGTVIAGKYKLLEEIGEGGMGTVWVAEQTEPVKRRVAVKLIKPGMDSKAVLARFEAERQALAVMDHPNIAKVLDGGLTDDHRPFFVMEYVKGVPITTYSDATRLSVVDRLNLFVQVCAAVQHAHQKGIIHRDLKPSNILVAPYDGTPVPKVIDFGLAKAMHQPLTEKTLHTAHGAVLGTPLYMSPEQAQLNNLDVDTRSDVYSLGVLLYELLTGTTPLERKRFLEAAWDEVCRIIREEEPPRPSKRLSSTAMLPSLAACRQTEPVALTNLVRGDLDWIVMKALDKDRGRRYETANGFSADVQRYLTGEAVAAHPPSAGYRLRKFVRRNRPQVIAGGVVVLALLAGIVGTTFGLVRAEYRWRDAEQARANEAARAEGERQAKNEAFAEKARAEANAMTAADEKRAAEAAQRNTRAALDTLTDDVVETLLGQHQLDDAQRAFLQKVVKLYADFAASQGTSRSARLDRANGLIRVARIRYILGDLAEPEAACREAEALLTPILDASPDDVAARMLRSRSRRTLGGILTNSRSLDDAVAVTRQAVEDDEHLYNLSPTDPVARHNLGSNLVNLAVHFRDAPAHLAEAETLCRRALRLLDGLQSPKSQLVLSRCHNDLGGIYLRRGQRNEALACFGKALDLCRRLAAERPNDPERLDFLAFVLLNLAQHAEDATTAERYFSNAADVRAKVVQLRPGDPRNRLQQALTVKEFGEFLAAKRREADAIAQFDRALTVLATPMVPPDLAAGFRQQEANVRWKKGIALERSGRPAEAAEQFRASLSVLETLAADYPADRSHQVDLGDNYGAFGWRVREGGQPAESLAWFDKAITRLDAVRRDEPGNGPATRCLRNAHYWRAQALVRLDRHADALPDFRAAIELQALVADTELHRRDHVPVIFQYGQALRRSGKPADAETAFDRAIRMREAVAKEFPDRQQDAVALASAYFDRGLQYVVAGTPNQVVAWTGRAVDQYELIRKRWPESKVATRLGWCHVRRAQALTELRRFEEADRNWDRAEQLVESPKDRAELWNYRGVSRIHAGRAVEALADIEKRLATPGVDGDALYQSGCVYAVAAGKVVAKKQEYADRGMELLHKAVKAGYKDSAHMKKDTDLDPLRGRADFKALAAEVDAKAKTPAEVKPHSGPLR